MFYHILAFAAVIIVLPRGDVALKCYVTNEDNADRLSECSDSLVCEFWGSQNEKLLRCGGDVQSCQAYDYLPCSYNWAQSEDRCVACCDSDGCNKGGPIAQSRVNWVFGPTGSHQIPAASRRPTYATNTDEEEEYENEPDTTPARLTTSTSRGHYVRPTQVTRSSVPHAEPGAKASGVPYVSASLTIILVCLLGQL